LVERSAGYRDCGEHGIVRFTDVSAAAYLMAGQLPNVSDALSSLADLIKLAAIVERELGVIRSTPVTFASGGHAVDASVIVPTMERMFAQLDANTEREAFTHAVLDVHPFPDGNGRTASLLLNWLSGTLLAPGPLPDFYPADE
jgi:hypothetical protein